MTFDFDVITIGAGVIGVAISDELAKNKYKVAILERNPRVAQETSEGNSGIIHGGFDPTPGKLNATLNLQGRKIYEKSWFKELDFPWTKIDSLVLAFNKEEMSEVGKLYKRGLTNGVSENELKVLTKEQVMKLEPNVNSNIVGALLCTASYVVDPVLLTQSLVKRALKYKAQLFLNHEVISIKSLTSGFKISCRTNNKELSFTCQYVINAAGHYADEMANMIDCHDFTLKTRRGQYCILEKTERNIINNHVLFMVPTIHGKGVIVAPMTDGHILVGPTAIDNVAKNETRIITVDDIKYINKIGLRLIPSLKMNKTCKVISGSRPISVETDDFVIASASNNKNFINVTGIKSPGLSAAPAIALLVAELLK
ncbi:MULTISPECIES: type 2 glycerol-3-phosphate oxidase [unclassified Spiroplasma]|uniref:type 2 glycerol-3-phosphate oxidase n=1 Tax=unclassified Spiroplasma TaxID=2637901 RepID=UPI0027E015EC|nr:type 2 glycerol-3-phosphate oxidase [Spiroplasma sp. AdecLV25b]